MAKSHSSILFRIFTAAALAWLTACGNSRPLPVTDLSPEKSISENTPGPPQAGVLASPQNSLPHSLYFLGQPDGNTDDPAQLWRLASDGATLSQIARGETGITDYDIASQSGRLAYIDSNRLYLDDARGGAPALILEGGLQQIHSPRWSPDENTLAFGQRGIVFYTPETSRFSQVLADGKIEIDLDGSPASLEGRFSPYGWSPDGQHLLVAIALPHRGGTLGILTPASGKLALFQAPVRGALACCTASWTPDGRAVLVANANLSNGQPTGLWRFRVEDGMGEILIPPVSDDGTLNYAGWPVQAESGDLFYFFANSPAPGLPEMPLSLVRAGPDGVRGRALLRPDAVQPREVLWETHVSPEIAVIVQPVPGTSTWVNGGPVILIHTNGGAVRPMIPNGYRLRWGP